MSAAAGPSRVGKRSRKPSKPYGTQIPIAEAYSGSEDEELEEEDSDASDNYEDSEEAEEGELELGGDDVRTYANAQSDLDYGFFGADSTESQDPARRWRGLNIQGVDLLGESALDQEAQIEERLFAPATAEEDGQDNWEWEEVVREQHARMHAALRERAGIRKPTASRGPALEPLPAHLQTLFNKGRELYLNGEAQEALESLQAVIKAAPWHPEPFETISHCWEELGNERKALQFAVLAGFIDASDADWGDLGGRSLQIQDYTQATYCYTQAVKRDRADFQSTFFLAQAQNCSGDSRAAVATLTRLLKLAPFDPMTVESLIKIRIDLGDYTEANRLFERQYMLYRRLFPGGNTSSMPDTDAIQRLIDGEDDLVGQKGLPRLWVDKLAHSNTFQPYLLNSYVDSLNAAQRHRDAVRLIREGQRWYQGRLSETWWNDRLLDDDDREYDIEDPEGTVEEAYNVPRQPLGRRYDSTQRHPLTLHLRHRLARARFKMGQNDEGMRQLGPLTRAMTAAYDELGHDAFIEFYVELSNDLVEAGEYSMGLSVLSSATGESPERDYPHVNVLFAQCYFELQEYKNAEVAYRKALDGNEDDVTSKLRLAETLEVLGRQEEALLLIKEVVDSGARKDTSGEDLAELLDMSQTQQTQQSLFEALDIRAPRKGGRPRAARVMNPSQKKQLEEIRVQEAEQLWRVLNQLDSHVFVEGWWRADVKIDAPLTDEQDLYLLNGRFNNSLAEESSMDVDLDASAKRYAATREWLEVASKLVDQFRSTRTLFPANRFALFTGVHRVKRRRATKRAAEKTNDLQSQTQEIFGRLMDSMADDRDDQPEDEAMEPLPAPVEQTSFRGADFDEWVVLFMKYAFVLTKVGDYATAKEDIEHLMNSNVIHSNQQRRLSMHLCQMSCALYARQFKELFNLGRPLVIDNHFWDEPIRLLTTLSHLGGFYAIDEFISSAHTKAYQRRQRFAEEVVNGTSVKWDSKSRRWLRVSVQPDGDDDDDEDEGDEDEEDGNRQEEAIRVSPADSRRGEREESMSPPTRISPINEIFAGHMLMLGNSYKGAVAYYLRGYMQNQSDALSCLLLTCALLSRASNRQVDNRHHVILQAMSMLTLYSEARTDHSSLQEVSYNFGRAYHHAGLLHLAVLHYQEVLRLQEEAEGVAQAAANGEGMDVDGDDPSQKGIPHYREAAFNLSLIYIGSGNGKLAREVRKRWLTI